MSLYSLTFRALTNSLFEEKKVEITLKIKAIAVKYKLEFESNWLESFKANVNDENAYQFIKKASKKCHYEIIELEKPFDFGEDFGLFTEQFKGAMFGLGAGENHAPLHAENYDFPDDLIEIGSSIFNNIVDEIL